MSDHKLGVWPSGQNNFAHWLVLIWHREGRAVLSPSLGSNSTDTPKTNPQTPGVPRGPRGDRAPTEESHRHNGWLSLPLAASPDNYCTHMQKNLMRRLPLKADVPHGETFGSATSFTVLFAPTQFMRTSCTHEIGTLRMNFGSATSLAVLFYIRATR